MKILLIEDDREMADTLAGSLSEYYLVEVAQNAREGEYKAHVNDYGSIILDYMLPDMDGIELCRTLRKNLTTPILMLTGNAETHNKVMALNGGADDYILKPVDDEELHARIEAVMRRSSPQLYSDILSVGDLSFDIHKREVSRGGKILSLMRKELDLLEYLMRNAGRVVSRSMILNQIWESNFDSDTNIVDVHIKYLRDRVDRGFEKKLIKTVHGYGYKIEK